MFYLAVDCGNSRCKYALFDHDKLVATEPRQAQAAIFCSVGSTITPAITALAPKWIMLDAFTPLPITLNYDTPQTLGPDRIALAAGAVRATNGQGRVLVADIGTCVTYDLVDGRCFMGGNIGPGIKMQLQAMHQMTAKLPEVRKPEKPSKPSSLMATNTIQAMQQGVLGSIAGAIEHYARSLQVTSVFITGGNAPLVAPYLNIDNHLCPMLLMHGLLSILKYNEDNF